MTTLIPRLAALPAVRAAAEAEAVAFAEVWAKATGRDFLGWDVLDEDTKRSRVAAHLARLLDPNNPAADGVLADLYRRVTGHESAHADPVTDDDRTFTWQIVYLAPAVGMAQMPAWVDIDGTQAPTRYEAWARALLAHYDTLAARKTP